MKTQLIQWSLRSFLSLAGALMIGAGCNSTFSYVNKTAELAAAWRAGNFAAAEAISRELMDEEGGSTENGIVFHLEHGSVLRANGKFAESNAAFQQALELMNERETDSALGKGGREGVAAMSNLNVLIYRGFSYDRIMAHTYRALNFLALDNRGDARIELNRLYEAQGTAVVKYGEQIAKDEAEVRNGEAESEARLQTFGVSTGAVNQKLTDLDSVVAALPDINPAYGPYVNPFAEYLQGLFSTVNPASDSDLENGLKSLTRVLKMTGNNRHVEADVARVNDRQPIGNVTYVLYESNMAPYRDEIAFKTVIPVPVRYNDQYGISRRDVIPVLIAFSWPRLVASGQPHIRQGVLVNGERHPTETVADMNSVVAKEFKLRWPGMRNRIILSVALKTSAAVAATKNAGWLGSLIGSIHQALTKGTDSRTWRTLPANFQVFRIATPADRKLQLDTRHSSQPVTVDLIAGDVNVVYIKQTSPDSSPVIHQFKLK